MISGWRMCLTRIGAGAEPPALGDAAPAVGLDLDLDGELELAAAGTSGEEQRRGQGRQDLRAEEVHSEQLTSD